MCSTPVAMIGLLTAMLSLPATIVLWLLLWAPGKRFGLRWGILPVGMSGVGIMLMYLGQ